MAAAALAAVAAAAVVAAAAAVAVFAVWVDVLGAFVVVVADFAVLELVVEDLVAGAFPVDVPLLLAGVRKRSLADLLDVFAAGVACCSGFSSFWVVSW